MEVKYSLYVNGYDNKERIVEALTNSGYIVGAELEMLNEEDDTIRKVKEEIDKLQKVKQLLVDVQLMRAE